MKKDTGFAAQILYTTISILKERYTNTEIKRMLKSRNISAIIDMINNKKEKK